MATPTLVTPSPADPRDASRWRFTALVRRMLCGEWEQDARDRMQCMIGHVKTDAWGQIDLTANPTAGYATELCRSYDTPPAVGIPDGGEDVVRAIARAGHWVQMPDTQRESWAVGEVFVRVDTDRRGRPTFRRVHADRVTVEPDPDHPDRPMVLRELMRQRIGEADEPAWVWHVYDLSDPDNPSWTVRRDDGGKLGADVTEHVLDERQEGEAYPFRFSDGEPFIPYVVYRSIESGGFWHAYRRRELVEGTLNVAVYYTFFGHILRSASWPQRYVVNAALAGATTEDPTSGHPGPDGRRGSTARSKLVTDPATVVVLRSLEEGTGQPLVGQWQPGGDPEVIVRAVKAYEARLASYAGVSGSDQMRMSGDPRSGYAIAVSRTSLREQMRRTEQMLRRADEDLFRMTAAVMSRAAGGRSYPEEGYDIAYQGVPESPEERAARRAHVLELLAANLIDRVDAYIEMHPGTTDAEAITALQRIDSVNRALANEPEPTAPTTTNEGG